MYETIWNCIIWNFIKYGDIRGWGEIFELKQSYVHRNATVGSWAEYTAEGQRGFSAQYTVGQNPLCACPVALMYVPQWGKILFSIHLTSLSPQDPPNPPHTHTYKW